MSKLVQLVFFLITIYSATANAEDFSIAVDFTGESSPSKIVLTNKYCIDSVDDVIKLNSEGHADFVIGTSGGVFSKCGWVHSSATFEVTNSEGTKLLVFEFYKILSKFPHFIIGFKPKKSTCSYIHDLSSNDMSLSCDQL